MTRRVVIAPEAKADLRNISQHIRLQAPEASRIWLREIRKRILTLARHPERCPLAPESATLDLEIREPFYGAGNRGTYRVLLAIFGEEVAVLHVRHGARLPLGVDKPE